MCWGQRLEDCVTQLWGDLLQNGGQSPDEEEHE